MNTTAPSEDPGPGRTHLYDAVASQRDQIVDGFADQREALVRAVEEQRLAAMPDHMRLAALTPAQASAEIVQALQQLIAKEVARQLQLAVSAMMANAQSAAAGKKEPGEGGVSQA